jgi:GTP 3',8-cyclase
MTQNQKPRTVYWIENTLYLNITNKCSNSCYFCFKRYKQGIDGFNLKLTLEPTFEEIISELATVLQMRTWDNLVFCGFGEPTERLNVLLDTAKWVKKHFVRPIKIKLDTNGHGYLLNPGRDVVGELKQAGVEKVSVSLNAEDNETYMEICRPAIPGSYKAAIDFICCARSLLEVEVTAVRLPEVDLKKIGAIVEDLGVAFKVREYIPCFF